MLLLFRDKMGRYQNIIRLFLRIVERVLCEMTVTREDFLCHSLFPYKFTFNLIYEVIFIQKVIMGRDVFRRLLLDDFSWTFEKIVTNGH